MHILSIFKVAILLGITIAHPQSGKSRIIQTSDGNMTAFECGTDRSDATSGLLAAHQQLNAETTLTRRQSGNTVINAYMHLIFSTGKTTTIPDQMWQSQFAAINQAFHGTGFTYRLIGLTKTTNNTWAAGNDRTVMQRTLRRGTYATVNLFFLTDLAGGIIGQCSMPFNIGSSPTASTYGLDSCLIHAGTMPGGSFNLYNEGKTAVHEIGHWMGLFHTFEGYSCTGTGDFIADTPLQSTSTSGCPTGKDSCPADAALDAVSNYMDYSNDACYTNFSSGQSQRMLGLWQMYRSGK